MAPFNLNGWRVIFSTPPAYSVSKAALNALTRLLARELPQMRVSAVCPGWVATDMGGPTGGFFRDGVPLPW